MEVANVGEKVAGWPARIKNYYDEIQSEMRRVTWPNWKQVRSTTTVVIAAVFAFGAYFYVIDLSISRLIKKVFDTFTK